LLIICDNFIITSLSYNLAYAPYYSLGRVSVITPLSSDHE